MRCVVGLGNKGEQYKNNRHNIGFMALDSIAQHYNINNWSNKFKALISEITINQEKIILVKPQTYMNLSGQSVSQILKFYKININNLTVIYDDLDVKPGKIKIKIGGGSGGHNGIKSIDSYCSKEYYRIRLGIDHPGQSHLVTNYVLGDFTKDDKQWLDPLLNNIAENIDIYFNDDITQFLSKVLAK